MSLIIILMMKQNLIMRNIMIDLTNNLLKTKKSILMIPMMKQNLTMRKIMINLTNNLLKANKVF